MAEEVRRKKLHADRIKSIFRFGTFVLGARSPEELLDALAEEVAQRGDEAGIARWNQAILRHALPLLAEEVGTTCAHGSAYLRVQAKQMEEIDFGPDLWNQLVRHYKKTRPSLCRLIDLISKRSSSCSFGTLLAMTDTPDFVKSLLHRVGMSVTAPTTRTALESMSNTAAKNAKAMMKDDGRVKVSCPPHSFNEKHVKLLREAKGKKITLQDIMPEDAGLQAAGRNAVLAKMKAMREGLVQDVIAPEATRFAAMKLTRDNEGTLEGVQAVITGTVNELEGFDDRKRVNPFIVAGDFLKAGSHETNSPVSRMDYVWPISGPWNPLQSWIYLSFKRHFSSAKTLRRGRTALREDRPLFNEAWDFCDTVWGGRIHAVLETLRVAQLVNLRGVHRGFEGADHYQETLNKEIQRADTSRASHHVLDRLEDRLSAMADYSYQLKEGVARAWGVALFHRQKKRKNADLDIKEEHGVKHMAVSSDLFAAVVNRKIGAESQPSATQAQAGSAKSVAQTNTYEALGSFRSSDVLQKSYVKTVKRGLSDWLAKKNGLDIRERTLAELASEQSRDASILTGTDYEEGGEAAADQVVQEWYGQRSRLRQDGIWMEEELDGLGEDGGERRGEVGGDDDDDS
ncbi:hypothetical protein V8E36_006269 [Tilletia maclaganii]